MLETFTSRSGRPRGRAGRPKHRAARHALALVLVLSAAAGCGEGDAPDDHLAAVHAPEPAPILPAEEAIGGAQVATLDPAPMQEAEIRSALGDGPRCTFRYTSSGKPVLAARMLAATAHEGIVKLNGNLIRAGATPADDGLLLEAGRIRLTLTPLAGAASDVGGEVQTEADLVFEVGDELRAGYRGYYRCERERARAG